MFDQTGCKCIRFFSRPDRVLWSHVTLRSEPASATDIITADIRLSDENDQTVAELIGFRLQRTSRRIRNLVSRQDTWLYHLRWQARGEQSTSHIPFRERKHWLIFADAEGLGEELAKQLEAGGHR